MPPILGYASHLDVVLLIHALARPGRVADRDQAACVHRLHGNQRLHPSNPYPILSKSPFGWTIYRDRCRDMCFVWRLHGLIDKSLVKSAVDDFPGRIRVLDIMDTARSAGRDERIADQIP